MTNKPHVTIWSDGSTWPKNPGHGGWAAVLTYKDIVKALYGSLPLPLVTNNVAEVCGAMYALQALKQPCRVTLYTDSQYLISGIDALLRGRILKTNQDVWHAFSQMLRIHAVRAEHIDGHSLSFYNELADALASRGSKEGRSGLIELCCLAEEEDGELLKKLEKRIEIRKRRRERPAALVA